MADTEYVGVTRVDRGRGAFEVLSTLLADLVGQLRSDKNMRWSAPGLSFSRPIRWLVALLGDTVVPISVSTLAAGRVTRVHRTADQPTLEVPSAGAYVQLLDRHGVVVDPGRRRQQILDAASELSRSVGGQADHAQREGRLLDEITNLVEQPVPMLGSFAAHYLELPPEVLTTVMRKHQRYLPVRDVRGGLMPYFVAVANGACDHDRVRAGNEAVVRARFEDASFFWRADLQTSVEDMRRALDSLAFEERLGSMAQRADRIADVARSLAEYVRLSEQETGTLRRAAHLAKFDLASRMVVELTDLAGTMAREYARRAGEPESVAQALFDMELPRSAGDELPATLPGAVLALADRFDLLTGLYAAGAQPTGSSDPFWLRRAAAGVVSILRACPRLHDISIERGVAAAAERVRAHGLEVSEGVPAEVTDFIVRRYEQQLLDSGNDSREVAAILPLALRPRHADDTLAQLARRVRDGDFARLASALQRVRNIVPPDTEPRYETAQLREPAERALVEALAAVRTALGPNFSLDEFVEAARVLIDPINAFFDEILVMTPEREVREARLGLLAEVRNVASLALDWDALGSDLPAVG